MTFVTLYNLVCQNVALPITVNIIGFNFYLPPPNSSYSTPIAEDQVLRLTWA